MSEAVRTRETFVVYGGCLSAKVEDRQLTLGSDERTAELEKVYRRDVLATLQKVRGGYMGSLEDTLELLLESLITLN